MPLKTVMLLLGFFGASAATFYAPIAGVVAYVLHYHLWPEERWWGQVISHWGIRYSLTIALCLAVGVFVRQHALNWRSRLMTSGDWLLIAIGVLAGISIVAGPSWSPDSYEYELQMAVVEKFFKVLAFCLLLTHIVTTRSRFETLINTMIIATLYLGYLAWDAPGWKFNHARLDGIGGPDFRESSFLGAHFAMMLPLIGVQFLRGGWRMKCFCVVAGALTTNGLILTRTRAAAIALGVGVIVAALFAIKRHRLKIWGGLVLAVCAAVMLTDGGFRERVKSIETNPSHMDSSSLGRLTIWKSAAGMWRDHPLGVGVGNFQSMIGSYNEHVRRRDAHNTFVRCISEMGPLGLMVLTMLVVHGFLQLKRSRRMTRKSPAHQDYLLLTYGVMTSISVMLTSSVFMTQLYVEEFWWFLMLPICMWRCAMNETIPMVADAPEVSRSKLSAGLVPLPIPAPAPAAVGQVDKYWRPVEVFRCG
jgi:O-antigen ligase